MKPTKVGDPDYFHKVVDCQWACPAHTPVPEYIRLLAEEKYTEAYMLNWDSNVFPGILGRTCDRPCEPACRRVRTEEKAVAICRLKRVAADNKGDVSAYMPIVPKDKNGKKLPLSVQDQHRLQWPETFYHLVMRCICSRKKKRVGVLCAPRSLLFDYPWKSWKKR